MRALLLILLLFAAGSARAETLRVAVASNFLATATLLARSFEDRTGIRVELVGGASGALYAQILHGAPYDVFLSADAARIDRLEQDGRLAGDGRKTYAQGRLVLWSADPDLPGADIGAGLRSATVRHFAMADPESAPYGAAAAEVLSALALDDIRDRKAVIGTSVAQAVAFVATGNAELGFVGLSQIRGLEGAWIEVPQTLYRPIIQDAGLLARSKHPEAARGFFDFLSADVARGIIRGQGYGGVP